MTRTDTPGVLAPPPLIAAAALAFGLVLDWLVPAYILSVLFSVETRLGLGAILFGLGGGLIVSAFRAFKAADTPVEPWKPTLALTFAGPYRWMRNPIYVGMGLMVAGIGLALASDWTLVMLIPAGIVLHVGVVSREERYLDTKFGEDYRAYVRRVSRYGWPL